MHARSWTLVVVTVLLVGCTGAPDASPSAAVIGSSGPIETPRSTPVPPELSIPAPGSLAFPEGRRLPYIPPAEGDPVTPEPVVDAFLDLVHDPRLSYRVESAARWTRGTTEILSARRVDHQGPDRYLREGRAGGVELEAIVHGDRAAIRKGDGEWLPERAIIAGLDDLSHAVVIGDLGPDPDGGHRLAIDAGFDWFPREVADATWSVDTTEIVIDDAGRPMRLVHHAKSLNLPSDPDASEGVVVATFSRIGETLPIPAFPIEGEASSDSVIVAEPVHSSVVLPGGGLSAGIPGDPVRGTREVTYWSKDNDATNVELDTLVTIVDGLRYEVAVGVVPIELIETTTARERLRGMRSAIPSRLQGGDVMGSRYLDILGEPGHEVVGDGSDDDGHGGLVRLRLVYRGQQIVILSVLGPRDLVGSAAADRFLRSLSATD